MDGEPELNHPPKTALAFAGGGAIALFGAAGSFGLIRPPSLVFYLASVAVPSFAGGVFAGVRGGLGLTSAIAFGTGFLFPGIVCPYLAVGTQGFSGGGRLLLLAVPVWAVAFGVAGVFGAGTLDVPGWRVRQIGAAFLAGGAIGAVMSVFIPATLAALGPPGFVLGLGLSWILPWYIGGLAIERAMAAGDVEEPDDGTQAPRRVDHLSRHSGGAVVLSDKETGRQIGRISNGEFLFLASELHDESTTGHEYYVDAPTIDLMEDDGAAPSLVDLLRRSLGDRAGVDVVCSLPEPGHLLLHRVSFLVREGMAFIRIVPTYEISDPLTGVPVGIARLKAGPLTMLLRLLLIGNLLPKTIEIREQKGGPVVLSIRCVKMPFRSRVTVRDAAGRDVARFSSRPWTMWGGFDVVDGTGHSIGRMEATGGWQRWSFRFVGRDGSDIGTITKKWSTVGREMMKADTYLATLHQGGALPPDAGALLLGACLAADAVYREK